MESRIVGVETLSSRLIRCPEMTILEAFFA